jgi:uncharacterized protein (TIGR03435 family)
MTAPLAIFIVFALDLREQSEITTGTEKLPEWTQSRMYTVVARPPHAADIEQIRQMTRTLLEERFALKFHKELKEGVVNRLILIRPGILGPQIKPHDPTKVCAAASSDAPTPETTASGALHCGSTMKRLPGGLLHLGLVDVTMAEASKTLTGIGAATGGLVSRPTIDGTGLSGPYDIDLEFRIEVVAAGAEASTDDSGGPTFANALERQLGMKMEKAATAVTYVHIDNISEPPPQ